MKEFLNILGYKRLLFVFFALIIFRISITIPFCTHFSVEQAAVELSIFLAFAFGLVLIFAGNNVADMFYEEKNKLQQQTKQTDIKLKDFPNLKRLQGMYIVLEAIGFIVCQAVMIFKDCTPAALTTVLLISVIGFTYASNARKLMHIGNILMGIMFVLLLISVYLFDYYPVYKAAQNIWSDSLVSQVLTDTNSCILKANILMCIMVYLLTLTWDITGDLTNIKQDKQKGYHTLAIVRGEKKTKVILYLYSALIFVAYIIYWLLTAEYLPVGSLFLGLCLLIIPLLYYVVQLNKATKDIDYDALYSLLGMVFISLLFIMSFLKNIFLNEQLAISL